MNFTALNKNRINNYNNYNIYNNYDNYNNSNDFNNDNNYYENINKEKNRFNIFICFFHLKNAFALGSSSFFFINLLNLVFIFFILFDKFFISFFFHD